MSFASLYRSHELRPSWLKEGGVTKHSSGERRRENAKARRLFANRSQRQVDGRETFRPAPSEAKELLHMIEA